MGSDPHSNSTRQDSKLFFQPGMKGVMFGRINTRSNDIIFYLIAV